MNPITKDQIVFALQLGGIEKGDVVMMHSALSSIGYVEGGAETVIDAVLEAVGPEGTYAVSTMNGSHPFDPQNAPSTVGKNWRWRALPGSYGNDLAMKLRHKMELYGRLNK